MKRLVRALVPILLAPTLLVLSSACGRAGYEEAAYFAMDTAVTLRLGTSGDPDALSLAKRNAQTLLTEWESLCSAHDPDAAARVICRVTAQIIILRAAVRRQDFPRIPGSRPGH